MNRGSVVPGPTTRQASSLDGPFWLVLAMSAALVGLIGMSVIRGAVAPATPVSTSAAPADPASFLYEPPTTAPELVLTDQDGRPFSMAGLRGGPTLVFFGYTHCADVCPATMGILGQVLTAYGSTMHVVFVTVDPERDTVPWLKEYVRYMPTGFTALTGSATEIRAAADAWGVRFARVEGGDSEGYSMSHTAEVFAIDGGGTLRAHFPFGTDGTAMLATVRRFASERPAETPASTVLAPTPSSSPTPTPEPTDAAEVPELGVEVISSSVFAGSASPAILVLTGPNGRLADLDAAVTVQLTTADGAPRGTPVVAKAVRPPGVADVFYVVSLDIPSTGWWGLAVTATSQGQPMAGAGSLSALDPGITTALGAPAPAVATPTLADVGGVALGVTTDPLPDLRLSEISTTSALDAGKPFVLIVDSARFKITPACGKALGLAKFMVDRWPDIAFIHLEPFKYDVVTDTPVLEGSLADPTLVPAADAWGIGASPWGVGSMPWAFVVDRHGIVRAKYQGVIGSNDLDVIIALVVAGG